ncbi:MAG: hypothetical protein WC782_16260 [Methylococcaceae bacterium]|jgi:hypothetical protein
MSETYTLITEGKQFALSSSADGLAYRLFNKEDNSTAHLEGDDAAAFSSEYDSMKSQFTTYDADQLLAQLWDQGGYSWMATPNEEE